VTPAQAGGAQRARPPAPPEPSPADVPRAAELTPEAPRAVMRHLSPARAAIVGLFVLAVIGTLALGRVFFVPVVAATVLAMVMSPLVAWLERFRIPRVIAAFVAIALIVVLLLAAVDLLLEPLAKLLDTLPAMQALLGRLTRLSRQVFGGPYADWLKARFADLAAQQSGSMSATLFGGIAGASVGVATVLLLAFFLLASGDHFLQKLVQVLPRIRDKVSAVRIVRTVQEQLSHYFVTVGLINLVLGAVIGSICWYFELPNALLWGAIVTLFNFVPYVGPLASFALISVASAANFSTIADALVVPLLFAAITLAEGQVITPMIVGRRVALNPVVVFAGLMFWAWIWGVAGMILAVPILLVAKIWAENTRALAQWSEFLGPNTRNGYTRP
jgi:predicted PurR-regulated permease PerM